MTKSFKMTLLTRKKLKNMRAIFEFVEISDLLRYIEVYTIHGTPVYRHRRSQNGIFMQKHG